MFDYGIGSKILPMKAYILHKLHEFYWVLKELATVSHQQKVAYPWLVGYL